VRQCCSVSDPFDCLNSGNKLEAIATDSTNVHTPSHNEVACCALRTPKKKNILQATAEEELPPATAGENPYPYGVFRSPEQEASGGGGNETGRRGPARGFKWSGPTYLRPRSIPQSTKSTASVGRRASAAAQLSNPRRGSRSEDAAATGRGRGRGAASAPRYSEEQSFPIALSALALGSVVAARAGHSRRQGKSFHLVLLPSVTALQL
jgi:hypothetical protein